MVGWSERRRRVNWTAQSSALCVESLRLRASTPTALSKAAGYNRPTLPEARDMVQFSYFHLMPYAELDEIDRWPVPHKLFDPKIGHRLYHEYLDQMALADELGFSWVGCN